MSYASSSSSGSSPAKRQSLSEEFSTKLVKVHLDLILSEPSLNLRDHLSLACVCRSLRACYYTPLPASNQQPESVLWEGLIALRPCPIEGKPGAMMPCTDAQARAVRKIWSKGVLVDAQEMEVVGKEADFVGASSGKRGRGMATGWEGRAIVSYQWERATLLVSSAKLAKTDVKKQYKLSDRDLGMLKCVVKTNPYRPSGAPMRLYNEAAVESLALRLHGGVTGHAALVAKRLSQAAKAADTRAKNGTKAGGSRRKGKVALSFEQQLALAALASLHGLGSGEYDEYDDSWCGCY
ncbi:hypothetical protein JCM10213_008926 [Rhodosporidiobolus nylandii]